MRRGASRSSGRAACPAGRSYPGTMPQLDTPVRLGVQLQPQHVTYPQLRDAVARLEEMGVDILFNWDHFFPLTLRLVARHADIWHSFVTPDEVAHKLDVIARWSEEEERDTSGLIVSNELRDRTEADADALYAAGTRLFTLGFSGAEWDYDVVRSWLRWRDAQNA